MIDSLLNRALKLRAWVLLLGTVILSEIFTLIMNTINSLLWWQRIDSELLLIGTVDAFVVSGIVGGILVILFHQLKVREAVIQEEKAKTEGMLAAIGDSLCILDRDFRFMFQNKTHIEKNGLLTGKTCYQEIHGGKDVCEACPAQLAFQSGKTEKMETSRIIKWEKRYFENTASPILDGSGEIAAVIEIIRDITEQRQAEERLREYQRIVNASAEFMALVDRAFTYRAVNDAYLESTGRTREELIGKHVSLVLGEEVFEHRVKPRLEKCFTGETVKNEVLIDFKEKGKRLIHTTFYPYRDQEGNITAAVVNSRDITEQKAAQNALVESEDRYRSLTENFGGIVFKGRMDFAPVSFHGSIEKITGYKEAEFLAGDLSWDKVIHPADIQLIHDSFLTLHLQPESIEREYRIVRKDGQVRWVHERIQSICEDSEIPNYVQGIIFDITEKKLLEQDLLDSEKRYRTLFHEAPIPLWEEDLSGVRQHIEKIRSNKGITDIRAYFRENPDEAAYCAGLVQLIGINRASLELHGAPSEDAFRKGLRHILTKESYEAFTEGLISLCEGATQFKAETVVLALDGRQVEILLQAYVPPGYEGTLSRVILSTFDISERKNMEKALRKKEESLSRAQAIAHMGSWEWDTDTNEVRWSREVYNIYGLDPDTFSPDYKTVTDTMHPDSLEPFLKAIDAVLKNEAPFEMDYSLLRPDGEVRTIHTKGEVVFDDSGKPVQMIGTVYDITERKKYEEEMQKLAVITEQSAEGIAASDLNGNITFVNRAWAEMHGYEPHELTGKNLRIFHTEEQLLNDVIPFNENVVSNGHHSGEVAHMRRDGSVFPTYMTVALMKDSKGNPTGLAGFALDISEMKRMEEKLRRSLQEKETLLQETNHRIKNNLAVIISLLRIQSRDIIDEKAKGLFLESENRVKAMSMIHERLYRTKDLRNIDFGEYLHSLTTELFNAYRDDNSDIHLITDINDITLDVALAIPCALIVNELVTNSLKYAFPDGGPGEIHIALDRPGHDRYLLTIKDNGIGIPPDIDMENAKTMGLRIAQSLAGQIRADLTLDRSGGTGFNIEFQGKTIR